MTDNLGDDSVHLDHDDADAVWEIWAPPGDEDILARAAFERTIRDVVGLQDDDLYFRPGGWSVNLPATLARTAVSAGILAALFQLAGLDDLGREVAISAATFVASMDLRPVRPSREERSLASRIRQEGLAEEPITAERARRALPKDERRTISSDQIADALDRLVRAGLADHDGEQQWIVRASGREAWIRLRLTGAG